MTALIEKANILPTIWGMFNFAGVMFCKMFILDFVFGEDESIWTKICFQMGLLRIWCQARSGKHGPGTQRSSFLDVSGKMAEQNWYRCLDCWWFFFLPCHASPVHVHIFKLAIFRKAQNTFCQNRIPNTGSIVQWFPGGFYKTSPCCFLLPWNDTGFSIFFHFCDFEDGSMTCITIITNLVC